MAGSSHETSKLHQWISPASIAIQCSLDPIRIKLVPQSMAGSIITDAITAWAQYITSCPVIMQSICQNNLTWDKLDLCMYGQYQALIEMYTPYISAVISYMFTDYTGLHVHDVV